MTSNTKKKRGGAGIPYVALNWGKANYFLYVNHVVQEEVEKPQ